jgi:hypothetical protein
MTSPSTRLAALVFAVLALPVAACGGHALVPGGRDGDGDDLVPETLTIPSFVGPPVLDCGLGVGALALETPCQLGQSPVFETDCPFGTGQNQVVRFMLSASLSAMDRGVSLVDLPLGEALTFRATLVPNIPTLAANGVTFTLGSMKGTLTLTKGSFDDRTLDGWFSHLDFVWTSPSTTLTCTLDDGRFTTIPGGFL